MQSHAQATASKIKLPAGYKHGVFVFHLALNRDAMRKVVKWTLDGVRPRAAHEYFAVGAADTAALQVGEVVRAHRWVDVGRLCADDDAPFIELYHSASPASCRQYLVREYPNLHDAGHDAPTLLGLQLVSLGDDSMKICDGATLLPHGNIEHPLNPWMQSAVLDEPTVADATKVSRYHCRVRFCEAMLHLPEVLQRSSLVPAQSVAPFLKEAAAAPAAAPAAAAEAGLGLKDTLARLVHEHGVKAVRDTLNTLNRLTRREGRKPVAVIERP